MSDSAPELQDALLPPMRTSAAEDGVVELPSLEEIPIVILAGGRGTRLAPYTSVLPKPLMPVGDRSILEIVIGQLAECGAKNISFCVGYLAHLIRAVFDHQARPDVAITYVYEEAALGTAAPLRRVGGLDHTFIAMNGDVLSTLDYRDLLRHHRDRGNILTIAAHNRSITIDYGMLHLDVAERLEGFEEKPEIVSPVSMGIYVMEPEVLEYIPEGSSFDFPDLVQVLLKHQEPVGAYRYSGMWFDIGRADDYERAVAAWADIAPAPTPIKGSANGAHSANGGRPDAVVSRPRARKRAKSRGKRGT
jgi:NDP-sugar pyrophosphorylase family protein